MFRRKKRDEAAADPADELDEQDGAAEEAAPEAAPETAPGPPPRPQGPWDVEDAPEDEVGRIDLGGLQVPVPPDTEVRVDVSPEGEVVAATLVRDQAQVQVNAFAAPRSSGIWQEVLEEIQTALVDSGGQAEQRTGPFGVELHALVPTEVPGQGVVLAPARFVGVDGPRWFLRALFTGTGATEAEAAAPLEAALRDVVVVRGGDPMAVRDPLPLRLPREVAEQQLEEPAEGAPAAGEAGLQMPERGPEISEIR